ncbi:hypothetical protein L7F22_018381 [Adiantum nelumboides]|nr:hypothetical protein [Adiantum nelumboides]
MGKTTSMDFTLAKFNDDNIFTWQSKTMYLLMRKGLWNFIMGDSSTVVTMQDNHKAFGLIAQSLGDEVIAHIAGITDAKQAWNALNRIFGTVSKSSKINLLMQFYKLDKKANETMVTHINKFKALMQHLIGVKKEILEDEQIAVLLNRVDKDPYISLVSTLQNVDKDINEIESALFEFDSKQKGSIEAMTNAPQALYTRRGGRGGRFE